MKVIGLTAMLFVVLTSAALAQPATVSFSPETVKRLQDMGLSDKGIKEVEAWTKKRLKEGLFVTLDIGTASDLKKLREDLKELGEEVAYLRGRIEELSKK